MRRIERGLWGGGYGNSEQRKKAFSSIFTTDTKSFIHVTRIAAMHIIYMCRLRDINDSVLSSLKMEGIRLLFLLCTCASIRIPPIRATALFHLSSIPGTNNV
jgi:hypothetical protein